MSIVVYYMSPDPGGEDLFPMSEGYADGDFMVALKRLEVLRNLGKTHVCISTELAGSVGRRGVDTVADGKTPDGHPYEWSKAGRAGKMKR
jgi:hypothetical protein